MYRQVIFFIIIFILITLSMINIFRGRISATLATSGFLLATIIGLPLSRMFKIFWHQEKGRVVSQLDKFGIIILVLYIGVEFERDWLFGHWLSGDTLTAFGLAVLTGLLLGRFLGTSLDINKILSDEKNLNG